MSTVLISGAGVAGPTLAYWLARHGYRPTVVERTQDLRSSGSPVDVRGPAVPVAERMGVMPRLREAATSVTAMRFLDERGRSAGRIDLRATQRASGSREVELPRGDLGRVMYEASRDDAEFLFDDTITGLADDGHGVDVTFDRAAPRRFDLVIGADGLHSAVRRLVFGPEQQYVRHTGLYVATLPIVGEVGDGSEVLLYNTPGRLVTLHPSRGKTLAAFIYRSPAVADFDHRDTELHKRLLTAAYADGTWRIPGLLDQVRTTDELYFDSVSRVLMPRWSSGRIAVLGDAASCVSLLGEGSSLAIAGASTLATALAAHPTEPATAFDQYETEHRRLVEPKLRGVTTAARLMVPATQPGITVRNLATHLWPLATTALRIRRTVSAVGRS